MVKSLPKVLYFGAKVLAMSLRKSIKEEIELSRNLAKIRYQESSMDKAKKGISGMSLDEAQKILNVDTLDSAHVQRRFKQLFAANKNFLYLQSKVFRARETIDLECTKAKNKTSEQKKIHKHSGKFLFATYVLVNEKLR